MGSLSVEVGGGIDALRWTDRHRIDGWDITDQDIGPDEIEIDFRQGPVEYEIEIELQNGVLEIEIDYEIEGVFTTSP